jgi:hypothetical protein
MHALKELENNCFIKKLKEEAQCEEENLESPSSVTSLTRRRRLQYTSQLAPPPPLGQQATPNH